MEPTKANGTFLLFWLALFSLGATASPFERLREKNTFQKPTEVVHYYVERDAAGFIWSGMLDGERKAFTLWNEAPVHDSFWIASSYSMKEEKPDPSRPDHARIQVTYVLTGVGDGHGTRLPAPEPRKTVVFELKKTPQGWKIALPAARDVVPVVLESKFEPARALAPKPKPSLSR